MKTKQVFVFISLIVFASCNNQSNEKNKESYRNSDTIALVGGQVVIPYEQVDSKIKQQIYDELYRIYLIRKVALTEIVDSTLIALAASKKMLSYGSYLDSFFNEKLKHVDSINSYAESMNYNKKGITLLERNFSTFDVKTKEGRALLIENYKVYLKQKLLDSLKQVVNIISHLNPPKNPKVDLSGFNIKYTGDLRSKVTVVIISDFECDYCRKFYPIFQEIIKKYKNRVKFGFINYSSYVSISTLGSEAASFQGKFWPFYDSVFSNPQLLDTSQVLSLAAKMNLDMTKFKSDISSTSLKENIMSVSENLKRIGLYGTPTIIVNSNVIFNSSATDEIENLIEKELLRE